MSNLIIAAQPAAPNASPLSKDAHAPAGVKAEAKDASDAFEANLKEGLSKASKKEETKKAIAQALAGNVALTPVSVKGQELGPVDVAKAGKTAKANILEILRNKQEAVMQESLKAEAPPQKPINGKSVQLTPIQQMMLTEQSPAMAKAMLAQKAQAGLGAQGKLELTPKGVITSKDLEARLVAVSEHPEFAHSFEVESLDDDTAAAVTKLPSFNEGTEVAVKGTPVSKVSTSDFLDLRNLNKNSYSPVVQNASASQLDLGTMVKSKDGKKDKLEALSGREAFAGTLGNHLEIGAQGKVIDAPVTQGAAGKAVLSHDAIQQMTQQVNLLSQARQDGEIKIRLRPDHLGELHMSVKTQGGNVTLEIRAQNGESKKIIEESLATLKDSLGKQNLTLASVDVVNAPTQTQTAADQGAQLDMSQFRQNSGQGSGRDFDQSNGRSERLYEDVDAPVILNSVRRASVSARGGQGLDLIA